MNKSGEKHGRPARGWRGPLAALLAGLFIVGTLTACDQAPAPTPTAEELYEAAVLDAMVAEESEILPLVTLTPDSDMVTWQDGKVLLVTINNKANLYVEGNTIVLPGEVWTFTDREIAAWYEENKDGVEDWTARLEQLVGIPPDSGYTHVTAMWVDPQNVLRPAYSSRIDSGEMTTALPEDTEDDYREWFNDNIIWSYFESAYPWTRLGYTYDWADNGTEYGLTEFLVLPGAEAAIAYTDTIPEFIQRLEDAL